MHRVERIIEILSGLSNWTGKVVSFAALPMMFIILFDVVARYVFSAPTIWAEETNRFILTAYFLLGGAYCLYHRGHVRMDIFYDQWSPRRKAIVDVFTSVLFFVVMTMLLVYSFDAAWLSLVNTERTESAWAPLTFPMKIMAPAGCLLMLLQGAADLLRNLLTLVAGEKPTGLGVRSNTV